jgi:hypothetical protein
MTARCLKLGTQVWGFEHSSLLSRVLIAAPVSVSLMVGVLLSLVPT